MVGYRLLKVDKTDYLYDTTTNAIIKLPAKAAELLPAFLDLDSVELAQRYDLTDPEYAQALAYLNKARAQSGLLQPFFEKHYDHLLDPAKLQPLLDNEVLSLCLNVTEQCNLRCSYCVFSGSYEGERTHNNTQMEWDVARRAIDFFLARCHKTHEVDISFYGGEALLCWKLVKRAIEYIRAQSDRDDLVISISSNLTLLTEAMADFMIANRVQLSVSIDGPDYLHDAARVDRKGQPTHRTIMDNLAMLKAKDPDWYYHHLIFLATFDKNNDIRDVTRFFEHPLFFDMPVRISAIRAFDATNYSVSDANKQRHLDNLDQLIDNYLNSYRQPNKPFNMMLVRALFDGVFNRLPKRKIGYGPINAYPNGTCLPGVREIFVDHLGTLYICEKLRQPSLAIGHIDSGYDMDKIIELLRFYTDYTRNACQHCWAYRLCNHCFTSFLSSNGLSVERKRESCRQLRDRVTLDLQRFIKIYRHEPAAASDNPLSLTCEVAKWKD